MLASIRRLADLLRIEGNQALPAFRGSNPSCGVLSGIAERMCQLQHGVQSRFPTEIVLRERVAVSRKFGGANGSLNAPHVPNGRISTMLWGISSLDAYSAV